MFFLRSPFAMSRVALRKESVDRNMFLILSYEKATKVALRKESVDRNIFAGKAPYMENGRSPQGERG